VSKGLLLKVSAKAHAFWPASKFLATVQLSPRFSYCVLSLRTEPAPDSIRGSAIHDRVGKIHGFRVKPRMTEGNVIALQSEK
jgi:hypothetical protein